MNLFPALTKKLNSFFGKKIAEAPIQEAVAEEPMVEEKSIIKEKEEPSIGLNELEEPKDIQKRKQLTEPQKKELIRRIAYYETNLQINEWLASEGIKKMMSSEFHHYRHSDKWRPEIEKHRKEFESKVMDIPTANKVNRIKELDAAFGRMRILEEKSEKTTDKLKCVEKEVQILSSVQSELEGKVSIDQTNYYYTQFNAMSKPDFEKLKLDCIRKIEKFEGEKDARTIGEAKKIDGNRGTQSLESTSGE